MRLRELVAGERSVQVSVGKYTTIYALPIYYYHQVGWRAGWLAVLRRSGKEQKNNCASESVTNCSTAQLLMTSDEHCRFCLHNEVMAMQPPSIAWYMI